MATVTGTDADTRALAIARGKARDSALELDFQQVNSTRMPLPDESFDRVVSSLFFHHLTPAEKSATLAEIRRVLKPGGELHIADWGKPSNALMRALFLGCNFSTDSRRREIRSPGRCPDCCEAPVMKAWRKPRCSTRRSGRCG